MPSSQIRAFVEAGRGALEARAERDCTTCHFEDIGSNMEPCLSASRGSNCDAWSPADDDMLPIALDAIEAVLAEIDKLREEAEGCGGAHRYVRKQAAYRIESALAGKLGGSDV